MYLLDANTYIEAKNRYYQMNFCPAYWDWLDHKFDVGALASVSTVYDEIAAKGDDLSAWVLPRRHHFLDVTSDAIQTRMAEIANHVVGLPNKSQGNVANFLGGADPWLVAKASLDNEIVVTQEVPVDAISKKVKIPNICQHFNVDFINTFQLLEQLDAQFVFENP